MTPMQQLFLGAGTSKKTYLDDVFSTFLYQGNGGANQIVNGIDNTKESMVWLKNRGATAHNLLIDTIRGGTSYFFSDTNAASATDNGYHINTFNNNGFTLQNSGSGSNANTNTFASFNFKSTPGFFDCVSYTGSGSTQQIAHGLKCIPGCYMIKCTSHGGSWMVYHRQVNSAAGTASTSAANFRLMLDGTSNAQDDNVFGDTAPTATHFTAGSSHAETNQSGRTYMCYLFGGGESSAAAATSCNFLGASSDGNDNKIWVGNASNKTADLVYGTGDFTWEAWFNPVDSSNAYKRIIHHGHEWNQNNTVGLMWDHTSYNNTLTFWSYALNSSAPILTSKAHAFQGSWNHVAVTRSSGTFRLFVNGTLESTNTSYSASVEGSETTNYATIGATHNLNQQECFRGNISNVRIVKGTAVYTSSFRPPTEPLTNITNTKLLCCNGSSTTSATVTPKTLVSDATVTINTSNSPFDDPNGFVIGEEENENIIKTGSYIGFGGGGSGSHIDVHLGWEPQWIIVKNASATSGWNLFNSMSGVPTGGLSEQLAPNTTAAENNYNVNQLDFTSTGFRVNIEGNSEMNQADSTHIFIAIRREDPRVARSIDDATKVFAMDTGNSSATQAFTSGFPVDFAFNKRPATQSQYEWEVGARLMQGKFLYTWKSDAEISYSDGKFDDNTGWLPNNGYNTTWQSWMWKRHAGFDVVTDTSAQWVRHSLNRVPEMVLIKHRTVAENWFVWHKDLNGGGSNSIGYFLGLNGSAAQANSGNVCPIGNTLPTATAFQSDSDSAVRNANCIAFLFASVDGISKVGSYTGNGNGSSGITVTTGFQLRFLIIKRADGTGSWFVMDSLRGMSNSGDEKLLKLNSSDAQLSDNIGNTSSTGFTITSTSASFNANGGKYIYYCHA